MGWANLATCSPQPSRAATATPPRVWCCKNTGGRTADAKSEESGTLVGREVTRGGRARRANWRKVQVPAPRRCPPKAVFGRTACRRAKAAFDQACRRRPPKAAEGRRPARRRECRRRRRRRVKTNKMGRGIITVWGLPRGLPRGNFLGAYLVAISGGFPRGSPRGNFRILFTTSCTYIQGVRRIYRSRLLPTPHEAFDEATTLCESGQRR